MFANTCARSFLFLYLAAVVEVFDADLPGGVFLKAKESGARRWEGMWSETPHGEWAGPMRSVIAPRARRFGQLLQIV